MEMFGVGGVVERCSRGGDVPAERLYRWWWGLYVGGGGERPAAEDGQVLGPLPRPLSQILGEGSVWAVVGPLRRASPEIWERGEEEQGNSELGD